jgi:hypothetical protein
MALTAEALVDFVIATDPYRKKGKLSQAAQKHRRYPIVMQLTKKGRYSVKTGGPLQRNIMTKTNNTGRQIGLFSTDILARRQMTAKATVGFRHTESSWTVDVLEEIMNGGPEQIFNYVDMQKLAAEIDHYTMIEEQALGAPASPADDLTVHGLSYWIPEGTPGSAAFTSDLPAGHAGGAGGVIAPNWKSAYATYTNMTDSDGLEALRDVLDLINWESPAEQNIEQPWESACVIYCNYATYKDIKKAARGQNATIGVDLDFANGKVTVNGNPVVVVPAMDAMAAGLCWIVNWSAMEPCFLKGRVMRHSRPEKVFGQHNVVAGWVDTSWNLLPHYRNLHGRIQKA